MPKRQYQLVRDTLLSRVRCACVIGGGAGCACACAYAYVAELETKLKSSELKWCKNLTTHAYTHKHRVICIYNSICVRLTWRSNFY